MTGRCGECRFWQDPHARRYSAEISITTAVCVKLNNDFCCGGAQQGLLAGCTAGGGFETTAKFGCVLFERREDARLHKT